MSGFGERFRKAGYRVPKPLIEIEGKPIIAHVIDMFPGETDFLFICNNEHLNHPDYRMKEILNRYCPSGEIVGIEPHKLGPVHAVQVVREWVKKDEPVVVNYCDFTCYWDWSHFKDFTQKTGCIGAIPAYKGFHPHSLGTTNYAYIREKNFRAFDIQEKQPFTDNRMEEYASSGTYYFRSGQIMLDAFDAIVQQGLSLNGEYYVSLAYKPLFETKQPIAVYPLQHFMQWGTPQDVAEYNNYSAIFHRQLTPETQSESQGSIIVPMAGLGQRFAREGYTLTKPLIPVSGKPMVVQATRDLPLAQHYTFVLRKDMPSYESIEKTLLQEFPTAQITTIAEVTEGQAITAKIGLDAAKSMHPALPEPITFGACDNGVQYKPETFSALIKEKADVLVWGVRGHAHARQNPQMYGWIDAGPDGYIQRISVKKPLDHPERDPIVLGTFTFRNAEVYEQCLDRMVGRNGKINNEYYIDEMINDALSLGYRCRLFEVDAYLSWGTPNDLRTYEYWQSCFHKWQGHPYRLENDRDVPRDQVQILEERFRKILPLLEGIAA